MFTRSCVTLHNHQAGIPPLSAVHAFLFITLQVPECSGTRVLHPQPENLIGDIPLMLLFFFLCLFDPFPGCSLLWFRPTVTRHNYNLRGQKIVLKSEQPYRESIGLKRSDWSIFGCWGEMVLVVRTWVLLSADINMQRRRVLLWARD